MNENGVHFLIFSRVQLREDLISGSTIFENFIFILNRSSFSYYYFILLNCSSLVDFFFLLTVLRPLCRNTFICAFKKVLSLYTSDVLHMCYAQGLTNFERRVTLATKKFSWRLSILDTY